MSQVDGPPPEITLLFNGWPLLAKDVGLGVHCWRLLEALSRRHYEGLRIKILVPAGESGIVSASPPLSEFLHEVAIPRIRNPLLREFLWEQKIGAYARKNFPEAIFHSTSPFASHFHPEKTIVTWHDCIPRHLPAYLGKRFLRKWIFQYREKFLKKCKVILTVSEHARSEIIHFYGLPESRVKILPNWLPPEYNPESASAGSSEAARRYNLPEKYWLYVGGYDFRKNVSFLLSAYAEAARTVSCPPLVLAGKIPQDNTLCMESIHARIAQLSLTGQILQPGYIKPEHMPGLYGGASLLIYPSIMEGFGMPPMEAMGCGCPALVADNSSLPEVVKDNSHRFATRNIDKLVDLLKNAAIDDLAFNPSFLRANFSEENALVMYMDIIKKL